MRELAAADRTNPDAQPRTIAQLRADALVELCRRGIAAPSNTAKPRITLNVAAGVGAFARLCELSNGDVIRPAALLPYVDQLDVNAVLFDERATAVKTSPQRCFTGMLRRIIEVLHNGELQCRYHNRIWKNRVRNDPLRNDRPAAATGPPGRPTLGPVPMLQAVDATSPQVWQPATDPPVLLAGIRPLRRAS